MEIAGELHRYVERVFDPSRKRKALGTQEAGSGSMTQAGNDVRFDAHSGLAPDVAPCPKSANRRHLHKTAISVEVLVATAYR
jgi:hypothetical protein